MKKKVENQIKKMKEICIRKAKKTKTRKTIR